MTEKIYHIENQELETELKKIKRELHLSMNGVASESMSEKGLDYELNYGVQIVVLRKLAKNHTPSVDLAEFLWRHHTVREMKLMAIFLMPFETMDGVRAKRWCEGLDNTELSEALSFYLFSKIKDPFALIDELLSDTNSYVRQTAFLTLSKCANQLNEAQIRTYRKRLMASMPFPSILEARVAAGAMASISRAHPGVRSEVRAELQTLDQQDVEDENSSEKFTQFFITEDLEELEFMA